MRATRDQIIAAQDAWQDAHRAYRDEADKYAKRLASAVTAATCLRRTNP
jgi:hypothetical protein